MGNSPRTSKKKISTSQKTGKPHLQTKAMKLAEATSIAEQIKEKCESAKRIVLFVAQVDPDAIGSAMLFRYYLKAVLGVSSSTIEVYYGGAVSHPQNKCIFNLFELDTIFHPVPKEVNKEDGAVWVLLDSCSLKDARFEGTSLDLSRVDIIIDHHKKDMDELEDEGRLYLMESIGSAATLVVQLFENEFADLSILEDSDDKSTAMTLGAIGVKNDTRNFTSAMAHKKDFGAFAKLYPYCDRESMLAVENYPLDRLYPILRAVLNNQKIAKSRIIASAGYIDEEDGDLLAEACTQLIRDSRVSVAIVWGAVESTSKIRLSFRSQDPTLNLHDKIRQVFGGGGKQKKGVGEGGAVLNIGDLGSLDTSGVEGEEYQTKLLELIEALIEMKVSIMLRE